MKRISKFVAILSLMFAPAMASAQSVDVVAGRTSSDNGTANRTDYTVAANAAALRLGFHRMEKQVVGSEQELFASFGHPVTSAINGRVFGSVAIDSDGIDTVTAVLPEYTAGLELGTGMFTALGKFEKFQDELSQWTGGLKVETARETGLRIGAFGTVSDLQGDDAVDETPYSLGAFAGNSLDAPLSVTGHFVYTNELLDYPKVVTHTKELGLNSVIRLPNSPLAVMLNGAIGSRFNNTEAYNRLQAGLRIGF
jgi:hypothetical protein